VELDGEQHGAEPARRHDAARSKYLASRGIRVLRFWNHELRENCDGVLDAIARELTPDLPLSGGGIPTSVR
jgi:very-short-patch-repair endonuclease